MSEYYNEDGDVRGGEEDDGGGGGGGGYDGEGRFDVVGDVDVGDVREEDQVVFTHTHYVQVHPLTPTGRGRGGERC